ncbi:ATP-binding cassette domain-containing protein [Litorihabitans aurantiacus]|uniref:ABC transporter ATP-binding protein n=1 Tax=Litorihabitans aurantiacus TaxID=1930061 RepID=A0AA37XFA0_9MICO|nr:ATP-binding cassette domain-containing protein [Litorihabitans aurantiacus]GMA31957.1 ABC transporter ATP-binding protein [Litorihabitans aurantiacus]
MTGALVSARGVAFGYPARPVLADVSLTVGGRDRIGLVGENGSGKSTLLQILAGRLDPQAGAVRRRGTLTMVAQELQVSPHETLGELLAASMQRSRAAQTRLEEAAEAAGAVESADTPGVSGAAAAQRRALAEVADAVAAFEEMRAWDADRELDEALTRFGAPREASTRLAEMSVGERYRVHLACALAERSDVLLLDEPTNHLDLAAIEHLTDRLALWPGAVVLVTHDRQLLDDVVTEILDLDSTMAGPPTRYGALHYADYRAAKDAALARWRTRFRTEQRRLEQLFWSRDTAYEGLSDEWRPPKGSNKNRRGTRAKQHITAADRQLRELEARAVAVPPPPPEVAWPHLGGEPDGHGNAPLLLLPGAHVPGRLERGDLMLAVGREDRLLLVGPNGRGKSTLLGLLAQAATAPDVRVGVLWQESRLEVRGRETGFDVAARVVLEAVARGGVDADELVPIAATGLLSEADLDRPVVELSVGQRRRLDLALVLMTAPHVLLMDEPTNHLAVDLVDSMTTWLRWVACAVVVATHDRLMREDYADWPTIDLGAPD